MCVPRPCAGKASFVARNFPGDGIRGATTVAPRVEGIFFSLSLSLPPQLRVFVLFLSFLATRRRAITHKQATLPSSAARRVAKHRQASVTSGWSRSKQTSSYDYSCMMITGVCSRSPTYPYTRGSAVSEISPKHLPREHATARRSPVKKLIETYLRQERILKQSEGKTRARMREYRGRGSGGGEGSSRGLSDVQRTDWVATPP